MSRLYDPHMFRLLGILLLAMLIVALRGLIARRRRSRGREDEHHNPVVAVRKLADRVSRIAIAADNQNSRASAEILGEDEEPERDSPADDACGTANGAFAGKTVLIADDDFDLAQALTLRLNQIGIHSVKSSDALHALIGIHKILPDLIIMDVNIPSGNGLAVCEMLASDPHRAQVPIIIYTGRSDAATINRCRELNLHYVQKTPGSWDRLRMLVCWLLNMRSKTTALETPGITAPSIGNEVSAIIADWHAMPTGAESPEKPPRSESSPRRSRIVSKPVASKARERAKPFRVLVIDDDPDISRALALRLAPYGIEVIRAFSGAHGFWTGLDMIPDLIITDMVMPDGEGNYIFGRFKAHPLTKNIPIIVLTGQDNPGLKRMMLSLGVSAYLQKPIVIEELLHQMRQHLNLPLLPSETRSERDDATSAALA